MGSTVIVAIPSVDDKVFRISSEKIPHLTLCFLGEDVSADALAEIITFTQHAASQLSPFGLEVDYRDSLGPDQADVLFFKKDSWSFPRISSFRSHLLKNDTIQRAYLSADQYPEWTPHLTLGYPETPAHKDESDYPGIGYVSFDRIAVWVGDFDGPEFRLKFEEDSMALAMSDLNGDSLDDVVANHLKHYGKKGMKWGVRNDEGHEGEVVKTKKLDKLDKKWEKENTGVKGWVKVNNRVADRMNNGEIDKFNAEERWTKAADAGHLHDWDHPETQAYYSAYEKLAEKIWAEETVKLGSNPSGSKAYEYREDGEGSPYGYLAPAKADAQHAEGDTEKVLQINRNADGLITGVTETDLTLKHYGVKGMKWGVTTVDKASKPTLVREKQTKIMNTKDVVVTQRKAGTYVKTRGGQRQKATDDAVKSAAARQKAKKSTTDALTNDELKAAVERMQLEQKFAQLDAKTKRRGQSFVSRLFMSPEGRKMSADLAKKVAIAAAAA